MVGQPAAEGSAEGPTPAEKQQETIAKQKIREAQEQQKLAKETAGTFFVCHLCDLPT